MKLRDALIRKSERLLAEAAEQRHPNGKETLTWAKATKGTVVVTLWGIALISLQSLFDIMLPPWAQTLAILFFVNVFGNSGYGLDWRGRFHLLCSIATIFALLGLFSQFSLGTPIESIGFWTLVLIALDVASWIVHDAFDSRRGDDKEVASSPAYSLGNRSDTRLSSEEKAARIDSRPA